MIHIVSPLCQSVSVYLSVHGLTGALQLLRSVRAEGGGDHSANAAPYLSCSSNLLWAAGVKAEGLSLSGDVNLQPFQFHPTRLKALPPGWSHVLDKGAFAFHFLGDKRAERTLYIVMLAHLSDISKIEVQAEDRYKLKVNTKKVSEDEERHHHVSFLSSQVRTSEPKSSLSIVSDADFKKSALSPTVNFGRFLAAWCHFQSASHLNCTGCHGCNVIA